jgi:DNA-binding XRE family transcriptional regulator
VTVEFIPRRRETRREHVDRLVRESGLTNLEAALELGVTEKTVWRWRSGERVPQLRHARRLAEMFGGDWSDYTKPDLKEAA